MKFICEKYPKLNICTEKGLIQFTKGEYRTTNKKEIALLKNTQDVTFEDIVEEVQEEVNQIIDDNTKEVV